MISFCHLLVNQIIYHTLEAEVQFTTRYLLYSIDETTVGGNEAVWEMIA